MLICLGGGGVRSPMSGGVPSPRSGGYPVPGRGGGLPHPRSGGTLSQVWGGIPFQIWGVPHLRSGGGTLGTPLPRPWDGVPPYLDLGWGTPLPRPEMGYPPYPDLRWGTPLPRPEMGNPPPPRKCGQSENITSRHPSDAGGNDATASFLFIWAISIYPSVKHWPEVAN